MLLICTVDRAFLPDIHSLLTRELSLEISSSGPESVFFIGPLEIRMDPPMSLGCYHVEGDLSESWVNVSQDMTSIQCLTECQEIGKEIGLLTQGDRCHCFNGTVTSI